MSRDVEIYDRVKSYVTNFNTAIDIGAHKGTWTERMVEDFEKVHCFEPNSVLYDRLVDWVSDTTDKVIVHNAALLDYDGQGSLFCDSGYQGKWRSHFVQYDNEGPIEVRALSSFRIRDCGLIKIDVEGGELPVIKGARRMLRHQRPVVVVEHKEHSHRRFGWYFANLYMYMRKIEYHLAFCELPNFVFVSNLRCV